MALGWLLSLAATNLCREMPREEAQGKHRKKRQPLGHVLLWESHLPFKCEKEVALYSGSSAHICGDCT